MTDSRIVLQNQKVLAGPPAVKSQESSETNTGSNEESRPTNSDEFDRYQDLEYDCNVDQIVEEEV